MKQNLSTTASITSTYAGELSLPYINAMFKAAPTLGNQLITIKENIKYKAVVKKLATSGLISASSCDFTPTGTITITERILEPMRLKVDLNLCKSDYDSDWEAMSMGASDWMNLPTNFADFLIGHVTKSVAASVETLIWQGDGNTGTTMFGFSGFTTLFKADSTVVDVSGATISSSNVIAELGKIVSAASALNTYSAGQKPVIYASTSIVMNYLLALGGFGASGVGANGYKGEGPAGVDQAPLFFAGLKIVEVPGLPAGQAVCANPENLWFGTALLSDYNNVSVIDQALIDTSDNVKIGMKWSMGVQYGIGAEIIYYWVY